MDNIGAEVAWSGTPTGTLTVLVSVTGTNWPSLTFTPTLAQPAGAAATMFINLNQLPAKFLMFKYVNASGTGNLNVALQLKDLN